MCADQFLDFCFSQPAGALKQPLFQEEAMHSLEVESQADETPFPLLWRPSRARRIGESRGFL
jgi:hypothetical protein